MSNKRRYGRSRQRLRPENMTHGYGDGQCASPRDAAKGRSRWKRRIHKKARKGVRVAVQHGGMGLAILGPPCAPGIDCVQCRPEYGCTSRGRRRPWLGLYYHCPRLINHPKRWSLAVGRRMRHVVTRPWRKELELDIDPSKPVTLTVTVNGDDTEVSLLPDDSVTDVIAAVLVKSHTLSRPIGDWDLRDKNGVRRDETESIRTLPLDHKFWLSLRFATCTCPFHVTGDGTIYNCQSDFSNHSCQKGQ